MNRSTNRSTNAALVLLALLHLGFAGCQRGAGAESSTDHPGAAAVRVRAIEERVFDETVAAPGQWRSVGEVVVNAPVSGILDSLAVRPGDRVTKGQYLGRLTTRESLASMRGAVLLSREAGSETARSEAERAIALARRELVQVPMIAARAGVVVRVTATAGSDLAEGGEIAAIVPDDGIVFEARVDPAGATRIHIGQATVITDGSRTPRTGVVRRVLPFAGEADQRTLYWITPDRGSDAPQIGRFGNAQIATGAPRHAMALPDSSIVEDDLTGTSAVAVVQADGTTAVWTKVILGIGTSAGWRELRSPPFARGTLVVTEGQRGLPDSTRVRWGS